VTSTLKAQQHGNGEPSQPNSTIFLFFPSHFLCSAAKVRYAGSIRIGLLLPDPAGYPKLQLLPVTPREEQCHVPLDDEAIMAVPNLAVAVTDASWRAFPYHFSPITTNLETIGIVPCFIFIPHKTQESHVNRCHSELEGLKVQAEVLPKTMKYLMQKKHQPFRLIYNK
jgi:hypothetical protein